jgi:hypothetical protein
MGKEKEGSPPKGGDLPKSEWEKVKKQSFFTFFSLFWEIPLLGGWEKRRKDPPQGGISQKAKLFTFLGNPPFRGMGKKKEGSPPKGGSPKKRMGKSKKALLFYFLFTFLGNQIPLKGGWGKRRIKSFSSFYPSLHFILLLIRFLGDPPFGGILPSSKYKCLVEFSLNGCID